MDGPVRLDEQRLRELIGEQHEYDGLDYKLTLDLSEQRDLVELVKDLAAMSATGGFIVVGASDDGTPTGLGTANVRHFDEANLRGRVRRYLPDIDLRSATHEIDGSRVVAIWVGPHDHGFAVLAADGQYRDHQGRDVTVFRQGDVFVRRGTASVRADNRDMERLRLRLADRERTRVRQEWAADLEAMGTPAAARVRLAWDAPLADFAETATELLRQGDYIPVRLLLSGVKPMAGTLVRGGDADGLASLLDRAACLCALSIVLDVDWLFDEATAALGIIYAVGHEASQRSGDPGIDAPAIWLAIAQRIYSLGALTVRMARWTMARQLALHPGEPIGSGLGRTWLRHALTHAARAGLLGDDKEARGRILQLAAEQVDALDCLRPDLAPEDDGVLDSICQFDALAGLAVIGAGGRMGNVYPSFGRFREGRTEPIVVRMIQDRALREQVAPLDDQPLADALRFLDESARQQFFFNWDQFYDARIQDFLVQHPPSRDA